MPRRAIACSLLAALVLAGCTGDKDTKDGRKITQVVQRFALSRGADACDMLTTKALEDNYGGTGRPRAKARCIARSRAFSGQAVDVTFVKLISHTSAHATAKVHDAKRYFSVALARHGDGWLIDSIVPTSGK